MNHSSLVQKLLVACLTILLAALALQWAVEILRDIWPQLAIAASIVLLVFGLTALARWQANRW